MASLDLFLSMSEELCGIPAYYLSGTGYSGKYLDTVVKIAGADAIDRLLASYAKLPACCGQDREAAIRSDLLSHDEFGPIARNIVKLWYTATWFELPREWHRKYKAADADRTFLPYPYAYPEALLGPAVGAHPAGAKPTGHQAWISPPDYLPFAVPKVPSECSRELVR
jgi:hypothetical protein